MESEERNYFVKKLIKQEINRRIECWPCYLLIENNEIYFIDDPISTCNISPKSLIFDNLWGAHSL